MDSINRFKIDSSYLPLDVDQLLLLNFRATTEYEVKKIKKHVLIILDISGSMSGAPINNCKIVIKELIQYMHNILNNTKIDLFTFNTKTFSVLVTFLYSRGFADY